MGNSETTCSRLAPQSSILDPSLFPQEYLCTEDEVYDLIAELDDSKSSDPDGISVKILKATITPSLTSYSIQPILKEGHLAKQSCNSGTVTGFSCSGEVPTLNDRPCLDFLSSFNLCWCLQT